MADLNAVLAALGEFESTFQKANEVAPQTVGDGTNPNEATSLGFLGTADQMYVRAAMRKLSTPDLEELFSRQLTAGIGKGRPADGFFSSPTVQQSMGRDSFLTNALDTTGGAALIRQDLDPMIQELFVRVFPAWQRIPKTPANGAVHAWDQITDPGSAAFMAELGTVTDDQGTYVRKTTNIAILNTRRGVTFKQQLAVPAGGMNWDAQRLEIQNGLTAMAFQLQKTIFQGQATNSGGTAADEYGLYDANSFDGLRSQLGIGAGASRVQNFAPYLTSSPDNFVKAINAGVQQIVDAVGVPPTVIYARVAEVANLTDQQTSIQRTMNQVEFTPGVRVPGVVTIVGELPVVGVPGLSIGHYTAASDSSRDVADVYILNEPTVTVPYLGAPQPTVLEIPPGVSGQLTRLWILWFMGGLAVLNLPANNKLRAEQRTS